MITGDHASTAGAIAAELGIRARSSRAPSSTRWTTTSWPCTHRVEIGVCARVSPEHKVRVVQGAAVVRRRRGAMTGDGVNDAAG